VKTVRENAYGKRPRNQHGDDQPANVKLDLEPEQFKQPKSSSKHRNLLLDLCSC
jgi:hypothetical protein